MRKKLCGAVLGLMLAFTPLFVVGGATPAAACTYEECVEKNICRILGLIGLSCDGSGGIIVP